MTKYVIHENNRFYVKKARGFVPKNSVGVLPDSFTKEDWPYLTGVQSNDPDTGELVWSFSVDATAKSAAQAEKTKADNIATAYKTMSDEVDAKMYDVFRTLKPEYASAEYETWQDMVARPDAYASAGLKVDHQINKADNTELFSPGSALDTAQKITDYAQRKIVLAQEYGVFRVQRIQQFKNEKKAIEEA